MVKDTKISQVLQSNTVNSVLTNNKTSLKSKQQIDKEYYQKNKEIKKQQRRERYQQQQQRTKLATQQNNAKYYRAEAIKILMTLKEYTNLNKEKHKLYADFCWTLQDCQKGINDIIPIMKLSQVADSLIKDYWETAKNEVKKGKSWNNLDYDQQQKLIRYWAYEKARIESGYIDIDEQLEKQSQTYLKDIELTKYHEERGKIKCKCYSCEEQKKIQAEVKAEQEKIIDDYERKQKAKDKDIEKEECPGCEKLVKKLDEKSGVCKKCVKNYNG